MNWACPAKYIRTSEDRVLHRRHNATFNGQILIASLSCIIFERSFEVKLPTRWTDGKAEVGRVREEKGREEKRREEERRKKKEERRKKIREEKRKGQRKEDAGAQKGRKAAIYCVFPMIRGSGGLNHCGLAKAAGAEPSSQMRDEELHAVVARSTF